jgi:hypothetical protein
MEILGWVSAQATPGPWRTRQEIDGYRAGRMTVVVAPTTADGSHMRRVVTVDQTRPHHDGPAAEANVSWIALAGPDLAPLLIRVLADAVDHCRRGEDPTLAAAELALADLILSRSTT